MAKVTATATHWATRGDNGELTLVAVTAMTTAHLIRWVRMFRNKTLDRWVTNHPDAEPDDWPSNAALDVVLRGTMPTGTAIYNELRQRGLDLYQFPDAQLAVALEHALHPPTPTVDMGAGVSFSGYWSGPDNAPDVPPPSTTVTITSAGPYVFTYPTPLGGLTGTEAESEKARKRRLRNEAKQAKAVEKTLAKLQVRPVGRRRIRVE